MKMQRTLLPIVFATALAVLAPLPVLGQSDATCIAYMEADAVYREAFAAALGRRTRGWQPSLYGCNAATSDKVHGCLQCS